MQIEIRTVGSCEDVSHTWDSSRCSGGDYQTARADALYAALGVSRSDDEYTLAVDASGRWALIGLSVAGYRYACEV